MNKVKLGIGLFKLIKEEQNRKVSADFLSFYLIFT